MTDNQQNNGVFREKSIGRVSGPESMNDYIRVTSPSVWVVLLAIVIILAGMLAWGFFGRVEVKDADGSVKEIAPITYIFN